MPLITEEFIGRLCEIKSMDHTLIGITSVINIINGDSVELAAPDDQDSMPMLLYRTRVKLIVYLRGVQIFEGLVYLSNDKFMRVVELKSIRDSDRRNAFRVDIETAAIITEPRKNDGKESPCAVSVDASVLDISITGMRLASHVPLVQGETYRVLFAMSENKYDLPVKVRRMYEAKNGVHHYGVSFTKQIHQTQLNALSKEIMNLQRHFLKRVSRRR